MNFYKKIIHVRNSIANCLLPLQMYILLLIHLIARALSPLFLSSSYCLNIVVLLIIILILFLSSSYCPGFLLTASHRNLYCCHFHLYLNNISRQSAVELVGICMFCFVFVFKCVINTGLHCKSYH